MDFRSVQAGLFPLLALAVILSSVFYAAGMATAQGTPGGTITAVNAKTGVVTGKVNSTGQIFTFTLANKAMLSQVPPGQGVYVNLGRKQVSLDGKTAAGTIVSILPLLKPLTGSSS